MRRSARPCTPSSAGAPSTATSRSCTEAGRRPTSSTGEELSRLRSRFDLQVDVTVDAAESGWHGKVGVVPKLIGGAHFDPDSAVAFVCGPEIMMHFAARALRERGLPMDRIYVSMERNMQCGLGHCGHCQLGPTLICRDGPVYRYDELERLMAVHEL